MKRLAIANRGEIAVRITRTAAEMDIETIGIHTADDAGSLHVRRVDKAVQVPGTGARGYLDIDAVVAAAKNAGADSVHPGYGFLSENAAFAEAVIAAGMVFVGPEPETLQLFGDKSKAVALARSCGVPTPGDGLPVTSEEARAELDADDYPIILKACSGGGGRGVRIVRNATNLDEAFERASSEATAAFGNGALYLEPYLDRARHIEVQIIGDGTGTVTHLWDRDCTLQRRHQKIIEVAPARDLSQTLRANILSAAIKLGEAVKYKGAGTMEFLVQGDNFYFIEGNARIQVEHTVTEEILGIDLVRAQLEIASGKTLGEIGLTQSDIPTPNGCAIQTRVCLETLTPNGDVRPATGLLSTFAPPSGRGIRVDTYGYPGYQTSPHYDSLIAKVISHAPDQSIAIKRLKHALKDFELIGAANNLSVILKLLSDDRVVRGEVYTRFIDDNAADFTKPETAPLSHYKSGPVDPLAVLEHGRGNAAAIEAAQTMATQVSIPAGMESVPAPMAGILINLEVGVGDEVWVGRTIAIVEAMKMEHEIKAEISGVVQSIGANTGETILEGHPLLILFPKDVSVGEDRAHDKIDLNYIRPDLEEALARIGAGHDENRPKAVEKRHGRGNRTARENITDLCDEGSFVEYGSVVLAAQRRRRELDDLIANTTGDGMVCGLGHVNGALFPETQSRIMAMSYDYMVLAGTQGALNHYKKDRMFEIAEHQRLPVVLYAEGGGGRPGDTDATGVAGLDCLAFNYFAKLSGLVPTIGIVNGRCFAGNAVLLGCCDVIIATENSNIGIGGPAMIEGGGLGVFTPDEVGPSVVQNANGVIDVLVSDEAEATKIAKQYLSYFQGNVDDWSAPDPRELRFVVPEDRKRWYDMRKVIEGIADTGSILELRRGWSPGIITSLIRVEGRPIGVVANDPTHLSGAIDTPGADKGARFLQLCDAFDIPVLSLIDCPGIMVGPEIEKTALVRHAARMIVVGANMTTPMMSVVIRKGYGLGAQAMAGGSFKAPLFCVSWPTGEFGGMGLEGAVKLGFRKELEAIKDPEERLNTYEEMVARMYERGKAVNMASHFEIDDVIDPADTRKWIVSGLKSLPPRKQNSGKKRRNVDTW